MGKIRLVLQILFISIICGLNKNVLCEEEDFQKPVFEPPTIPKNAYFAHIFNAGDIGTKWLMSQAKKAGTEENLAKYDGKWSVSVPETSAIELDYGLILESKARHHAIAAKLDRPLRFDTNEVVIQYEVKFQNGMECGGAYVKLLSAHADHDLSKFHDKTPFTIMFGPDKCGLENKLHFIFRHKNPVNGVYEEKFIKNPKKDMNNVYDKKSHLYTLVLRNDNTYEIYIDQVLANSGSLLTDFDPPVNPEKEIDDPNDKKPATWDDNKKISDPTATKPEDWDEDAPELIVDETAVKPIGWLDNEPPMVNDASAKKPDDWDSEIDGEWEPPQIENPTCKDAPGCGEWKAPKIKNPAYKGKWSPPLIDNPNYKGEWVPRKIKNPNYFEDENPFKMTEVFAVGLELWSMSDGVAFDNFLIVDSKEAADKFASETWLLKKDAELRADPSAKSVVDAVKELYVDKPWVVALIGFGIVGFIGLICYCLMRPSKSGEAYEVDALHKKDDDRYSAAGPVYSDDRSPLVQEKQVNGKSSESENEEEKSEGHESPVTKSEAESDVPSDKQNEKVRRRKVRKE